MRIISGKHKGRRIELGKESANSIRPTSDFAREAIFNILMHNNFGQSGHAFIGKRVLDVFCGTGAFGLEALSRGAAYVTFIDQARDALALARRNADHIGERDTVDFVHADATRLPKARASYALVFLDPPYLGKLVLPTLKSLDEGGWIAPDGLIIIERDTKETIDFPERFTVRDERRYGRALVTLLSVKPHTP